MNQRTVENTMFYGAKPIIFERAKELRADMTEAEQIVWKFLQKKKVMGYRFRAQHPINQFIADFYCHQLKLVIEVDGGIHKKTELKEYDINRTYELEKFGIKVIRFTNNSVFNNFQEVKNQIITACEKIKARVSKSPLGDFGLHFVAIVQSCKPKSSGGIEI
jgi:very-short-patch-repair endonuclease